MKSENSDFRLESFFDAYEVFKSDSLGFLATSLVCLYKEDNTEPHNYSKVRTLG